MYLQAIKNEAERKAFPGGLKALAEAAGMTEQKLHRCVRDNKIPAQDLERIAKLLKVSITIFFDERETCVHTEGDMSPASGHGDISLVVGDAVLAERVKSLEAMLAEKEARLEEKERTIQILINK